jgi:hypothetical protein
VVRPEAIGHDALDPVDGAVQLAGQPVAIPDAGNGRCIEPHRGIRHVPVMGLVVRSEPCAIGAREGGRAYIDKDRPLFYYGLQIDVRVGRWNMPLTP